MKKISIIILAAAMGLLAACVKEQPAVQEVATLTVRISSEAPAPLQVKTHLGAVENNKRKVYWSNGDAIRVNGAASDALAGLGDEVASASFTFPSAIGTAPYSILYPAGIWTDATHVTLPAIQSYKADTFDDGMFPMAGYSADASNISIHHLCAVLKVNILRKAGGDEHDLVSATFRGLADEQVSGNFELDYQNATLSGTSSAAADKEVKVVRVVATSTLNAASYYIVVPAGTYSSGIAIDVQDQGGDLMTLAKNASVTFVAGKLYDMEEVPFEPTGAAPANLTITTPEELIQFAMDYNNGTLAGDDLVVALGNDINFTTQQQSDDFNATGGIGVVTDRLFNGMFNGSGYSINGLQATVPLFARVGKNGTVKDLTMGSTSSLTVSDAISAAMNLGAIAGDCKGRILDCVNRAPVTCSSATRTGVLNMGGVAGQVRNSGLISGCENYGAITCTAAGSDNIYMGGVVGTVNHSGGEDGHAANIDNCLNAGLVKNGLDSGEPQQACILHVGGVVGWIYSTTTSAKMTVTGLVNTGNVMKTNTASKVNMPVLVAGIVGGIHGSAIASASGQVAVKDSYVKNCTIQNGAFDNAVGYGEAAHTGGFVGVARGGTITFSDNCYVSNVNVVCRRGYAGGFASWAIGTTFDGCNVIASAVQGSLAQLRRGGGLVGHLRSGSVKNCVVTLTKDGTHSLYGAADTNNDVLIGGIVGSSQETVSIETCKVFVKLMYVGANLSESHGWVLGSDLDASATIKDCGLGGTYGNGTADLTLTDGNFATYICGAGSPTITGTNYLWDASDAPAGPKSVEIVIADYATANSWVSGTSPQVIEQDDVTLTASDNGGSKNGNYNTQWRFYQARGGGLTVSVPSGKTLISATFTYTIDKTGILIAPDGTTQVPSGTLCPLSGNSAFFTVGNTGGVTNGQVRFTKIVVEYE